MTPSSKDETGKALQVVFDPRIAAVPASSWAQPGRSRLPGAVATVLGLLGLRISSRLVFSPLFACDAVAYGPIGTVLVLRSWPPVGVGVVVFGSALAGRMRHPPAFPTGPLLPRGVLKDG